MAHRLFQYPVAGIDKDDAQVCRRGTRHHVTGVLHVSRGIGNDKLTLGCSEIAVSHIDGDALLSLSPQTVGEQCEVHLLVAARLGSLFHGFELVFKD